MCFRGATQVYSVTAHGNYGGGYAVIAAEDKVAAAQLASTIPAGPWYIEWELGDIEELDGVFFNGAERVIDHFEYGE